MLPLAAASVSPAPVLTSPIGVVATALPKASLAVAVSSDVAALLATKLVGDAVRVDFEALAGPGTKVALVDLVVAAKLAVSPTACATVSVT